MCVECFGALSLHVSPLESKQTSSGLSLGVFLKPLLALLGEQVLYCPLCSSLFREYCLWTD